MLIVSLALVATLVWDPPQSPPVDTAAIEAAVLSEMRAMRSPGVAIAVVRGDRVIYERGFGVENIEQNDSVGAETLFRIGSATKMFTGLTSVLLAREGLVDLQAPIRGVATGLHPGLGSVTLHQLLTHTAGITNEAAASGPQDDEALARRVKGWGAEHVFAPAGDVYSYTGPGYWLAGYVLEQAAKQWYADVVTKRVLEPLGMRRSTFRPTVAMTYPVALDHRVEGERAVVLRPQPNHATTWPSGSLYSSVHELARFTVALMNDGMLDGKQVIPREVVASMKNQKAGVPGSDCGYTYGLSSCTAGRVRTLGHYGFRVGSGAVVTMVPDERIAVIILSNRNGGIFARTERAVLELLVPAIRDSSSSTAAANASPNSRPAAFAGMYANGADTVHFVAAANGLTYRYGRSESRTRFEGDSTVLVLDASGEPVQQWRLIRGTTTSAIYVHDGLNAFRRLTPRPPRRP